MLDAVTLALSHWPAPIWVNCEASLRPAHTNRLLVSTIDNDKTLYSKRGIPDPLEAATKVHEKEYSRPQDTALEVLCYHG
jgi:hypothetical protein